MWTDGQTDLKVLIFAFRNFTKAPKIYFGFEFNAQKIIFPYFSLVKFY